MKTVATDTSIDEELKALLLQVHLLQIRIDELTLERRERRTTTGEEEDSSYSSGAVLEEEKNKRKKTEEVHVKNKEEVIKGYDGIKMEEGDWRVKEDGDEIKEGDLVIVMTGNRKGDVVRVVKTTPHSVWFRGRNDVKDIMRRKWNVKHFTPHYD
jgi:DNA-directed RNA polymerase subunit H (RpoH/RPB5)